MRPSKWWIVTRSAFSRAARTFVQAFGALLLASGPLNAVSVSTLRAAAIAGGAAVFALAMRWADASPLPTPPAG